MSGSYCATKYKYGENKANISKIPFIKSELDKQVEIDAHYKVT